MGCVGVHTPQLSSGWRVGRSRRRLVLPRRLQGAGKVGARPSAVSIKRHSEYFVELCRTFFCDFFLLGGYSKEWPIPLIQCG